MDEERYANDVCLGEVSIPLKKIAPFEEAEKEQEKEEQTFVTEAICEKDSVPAIQESTNKVMAQLNTYTLFPMKEVSEPSTVRLYWASVPWRERIRLPQDKQSGYFGYFGTCVGVSLDRHRSPQWRRMQLSHRLLVPLLSRADSNLKRESNIVD